MVVPGPRIEDGQPIRYLAFVECDKDNMMRDVYLVGESGTICFEQPQRDVQPSGWQYTIKPPIPRYAYLGNLVIQIKRVRGDNRKLTVSPQTQPFIPQQEV